MNYWTLTLRHMIRLIGRKIRKWKIREDKIN